MLFALGKGLLSGILMSLMLGTVFFSLIQNSIEYGWKKRMMIASGVVTSDFFFITLAILGVQFINPDEPNIYIHGGAVIVLTLMGLNMLSNKKTSISYPQTKFGKALFFFSNGFLLNILNPVNFLFWAGWATVARAEWGYEMPQLISFFAGCLISIFFTEVLISFSANRIKPYLSAKLLDWINKGTGLIFIGIAVYLVVDYLVH